jgi:signal transduction histidine kinase
MGVVVYVIDDDPLVTESLGTALRLETGYDVRTFTSGTAALAAMPRQPPDVLITDFKMPALDGLQVLRATRQAYPDAVLILLTGYADKESAIRAINEVGIYQYVEKPWVLDDLLHKIHTGLERRDLALRLRAANADLERRNEELARSLGEVARAHEELRQTHERLIEAERLGAVGRVVSAIAHEIGNQLALVGYAEAIKQKVGKSDPEVAEFADVIVAAQKRLSAMVTEIKDFARHQGQAGDPLVLEPADVAACVEEALSILRYDRDVAARTLVKDVRPGPLARLHRGKFAQVVINLVRNAAQASSRGGEIAVSLGERDGRVILSVSDKGVGMPPEVLARLGEPFFTTRGDRGTGLGIGISKRIVEEHGGTLAFESTPGQGTRALVSLPALGQVAVQPPARASRGEEFGG